MKTLVRWNPMTELEQMNALFEKLFNESPTPGFIGGRSAASAAAMDVFERDNSLVVRVAVPGIHPDNLDISLEENVLTLRGTTQHEEDLSSAKIYRRELSVGTITRSVRLPEGLDLDKIEASTEHGIVTISIPKLIEVKQEPRKIPVSSGTSVAIPAETESN
ncbi:MAG: Hsp20/alpha crystallin family protein [Armatimonadetes bacterium]|nr:Hsp20/alpha crystallin family protein [Armatimonadota bacterium]